MARTPSTNARKRDREVAPPVRAGGKKMATARPARAGRANGAVKAAAKPSKHEGRAVHRSSEKIVQGGKATTVEAPASGGSRGKYVYCIIESNDALRFGDRKSTRLNSSHVAISYAVFCLK